MVAYAAKTATAPAATPVIGNSGMTNHWVNPPTIIPPRKIAVKCRAPTIGSTSRPAKNSSTMLASKCNGS